MPKKTFIGLCLLLTISFFCCKKDNGPTEPAGKTKTALLTGKVWIYTEYYVDYSNTALLYYKRDRATGNYANYDKNRLVYNADGTYTEITQNGSIITGIWKFLSNETIVQVSNPLGTFNSSVVLLDDQHFNWQQTNNGGIFCKMIPQ